MQIRLFRKTITFGYILIAVLIGSIAYTSFYEWRKLEALEEENRQIDRFRLRLHDAYVRMIEFSLLGETILEWENEDLEHYHAQRMAVDSMLCGFKETCPSERIDSLRFLLEDKETQMRNIVQVLEQQAAINKKIASQVPVIVRKSTQEQPAKPKRKGFLGIFGKKEKPKPATTATMLHTLNRDVIAQQQAQSRRLSEHADSLAARNGELNRQLQELISQMDTKVHQDLQKREAEITAMRENSYMLVGGMTAVVMILMLISYTIIHRNNRRINRYKRETAELIGQLKDSVRENEELIASRKKAVHTIIHELRTPLTAITGYAGLLHGNDPDKTSRYSGNILQASGHMTTMLNALLEFFRLDNGKEQPKVSPFRLRDVSDMFDAEFRPQAGKKDLRLTVECATDVILMGDKERIVQIGNNLLSNAVKFTRSGWVTFRLSHDNGNLVLDVEDSGSGMSDGEQQRIFNPFERLSNAATQDGFGLGLSIVKRIVDMLDGTIRLESEKGKGSHFTVTIPMPLADAVMEQPEKRQEQHLERPYSVVVLDDNEIVLDMVRDMYASVGVHCDVFCNIGDMMEAMRIRNYDFAIIDMKMPEINGFEALELMRSSSIGNSKEIPVVVATASGSCEADELTAHGFTACLFKPFSLPELMEASGKCLSVNADRDGLPDLTSLLAYGDRGAMLDRLVTETEKDMQAVREAGEKGDRKALGEWVHRLRSSWAIIRADKPLWEMYELLHQEQECSETELRRAVSAILEKGNMIVKVANEERRNPDEDICD